MLAHRCPWYPKGATVCEKDPTPPTPANDRDMLGNFSHDLETVVCYLGQVHLFTAAGPLVTTGPQPRPPTCMLGELLFYAPVAQTWLSRCCLGNLGTGTEKVRLSPVVQTT